MFYTYEIKLRASDVEGEKIKLIGPQNKNEK